ncbi:MAG: response regulator [Elusimicrobiota bacterium]|jgi:DNA-binding NtrC family response regulator
MAEMTRPVRVLLVDDEKIVRVVLRRFLSGQNVQISEAENGAVALELARKELFDIYFVDVRMPIIDGVEFLQELRKLDKEAEVVMMTGYALDEVLETAQKQGICGILRKPFGADDIRNMVGVLNDQPRKPLRVLVVDDDQSIVTYFSRFLQGQGIECVSAGTLAEAVAAVQSQHCDLVFLDLILSGCNGLEVYQAVRKAAPNTKVVVMTGYPNDLESAKTQEGLHGSMIKPLSVDALMGFLRSSRPPKS